MLHVSAAYASRVDPLFIGVWFGAAASQARLAVLQNLLNFDNGLTLFKASNSIVSNAVNQATKLNQALASGSPFTTVSDQ